MNKFHNISVKGSTHFGSYMLATSDNASTLKVKQNFMVSSNFDLSHAGLNSNDNGEKKFLLCHYLPKENKATQEKSSMISETFKEQIMK